MSLTQYHTHRPKVIRLYTWRMTLCMPVLCVLALLTAAGCQNQTILADHPAGSMPPDLSIELFIAGDVKASDPMVHHSRYLLEPDRSLHIAVNEQALKATYPPFVRFLTLEQMQRIAQLVDEHQLMQAPSTATPRPSVSDYKPATKPAHSQRITYHLTLTSWSRTHRFVTTLEASPGVKALLQQFIAIAKVQPSGQTEPAKPTIRFHSPTPMETP